MIKVPSNLIKALSMSFAIGKYSSFMNGFVFEKDVTMVAKLLFYFGYQLGKLFKDKKHKKRYLHNKESVVLNCIEKKEIV